MNRYYTRLDTQRWQLIQRTAQRDYPRAMRLAARFGARLAERDMREGR